MLSIQGCPLFAAREETTQVPGSRNLALSKQPRPASETAVSKTSTRQIASRLQMATCTTDSDVRTVGSRRRETNGLCLITGKPNAQLHRSDSILG